WVHFVEPLVRCQAQSQSQVSLCIFRRRAHMDSPKDPHAKYEPATTPAYDEPATKSAPLGEDDEAKHVLEFAAITNGLEYPQITLKALIVGTIVGIFVSVLAMYYSLKIGVTP
ncbi:hypothetical protein SDRG_11931, partial [Saprolegnia diclina VS20]